MSGLAGFDFAALNRRYLDMPMNEATTYGVRIERAAGATAWRCIGVYHLVGGENRGRHNVFVECLDEAGRRLRSPMLRWSWVEIDGPIVNVRFDKPANEPAADIPIDYHATVRCWIGDSWPSDVVTGLHARHADEGGGNTLGHHSYYVVFQHQSVSVIVPPIPDVRTVEDRLAALEKWRSEIMRSEGVMGL